MDIRLAQNEDAKEVKRLVCMLCSSGQLDDVPFDNIYPHWIVVEKAGQIVACAELRMSRPIASIENLSTDDSLTHRDRARATVAMFDYATEICRKYGSQLMSGMIPFERKSWKKVAKRHGGVVFFSGSTFLRRVA